MTRATLEESRTCSRAPAVGRAPDVYALLILIAVAVLSSLPFFYAASGRLPEAHDLSVHWVRMIAFDEALRAGVWYPRWLASMNYGYGAATTLFYAPGVYYFLSFTHAFTGGWTGAIEAFVLVVAAMSAVTFYFYARCWVGTRAAAVGTSLYLLLPYRLIDLYHRAALAELLAFAWMPLVMAGLTLAVRNKSLVAVAGGGLAFAFLVLSHPPTAYLFAISAGVFAVTVAIKTKRFRTLADAAATLAIGGWLSAFYWIPAVRELNLVKQPVTTAFELRPGNIVELLTGQRFERMIAAIALVTFALALLFYASARRIQREPADLRAQITAWVVVSMFAMTMMLPVAAKAERALPGFSGAGYLWRWLTVQLLATAITGALTFEILVTGAARRLLLAASAATALVLGFGLAAGSAASNLREPFIAPAAAVEEAFTPKLACRIDELPPDAPMARGRCDKSEVHVEEWSPQHRIIQVSSPDGCPFEVRTFAFAGWRARVDEVEVAVQAEPQRGAMLIDIPAGSHVLTLQFEDTRIRRLARLPSLATLIAIISYLTIRAIWRLLTRTGTLC